MSQVTIFPSQKLIVFHCDILTLNLHCSLHLYLELLILWWFPISINNATIIRYSKIELKYGSVGLYKKDWNLFSVLHLSLLGPSGRFMQSNLYSLIISYSFGSHTSVEPKMNQTGLTEDTFLLGWGYTSVAQHLLAGMRSCHRSHFSLHIAECEWLSETSWVERPVLLFFNPMSKSQFLPC